MIANGTEAWTQRLYERLPEIYRTRDQEVGQPLSMVLRAIAVQVAAVRQDLDDLWDDFFIESCEDWTVPYLGALVGAQLLANPVGQNNRLEVAQTIQWRRTKGTPAMLASLAKATTSEKAIFAEFFASLGWRQNLNHQRSAPGAARLTDPAALDLLGGDGDHFARTVDVRQPGDRDAPRLTRDHGRPPLGLGRAAWGTPGRYNLGHVGFFVRPLHTFPVEGVTPAPLPGSDRAYRFDPLGREMPLFSAADNTAISRARLAGDLAALFGEGRQLLVRRYGVALALAPMPVAASGRSERAFTFGDTSPVALHPRLGLRLQEPEAFRSGGARFRLRAVWRTAGGDELLGTLETLQARLGDQAGAFTAAGRSPRAGRLVLELENAPGAGPARFPETVISVRDDVVVPRAAADPATRLPNTQSAYQDALLVYVPNVFLQSGARVELEVADDGATYRAFPFTPTTLARASQGQVWPPSDLTRPSLVPAEQALHRGLGLQVPDRGQLPVAVLMEALASTGEAVTPQGAMATRETPLGELSAGVRRALVLPAGQTTMRAFTFYPTRAALERNLPADAALVLRLRSLESGPVTVCPQAEVVVTDQSGHAQLVYLPEVSLSQARPEAAFVVAEDGSTYRTSPSRPSRALTGLRLARVAAGQVLPLEGEFPLRRRPVASGVGGQADLSVDPERGQFCLPARDPLLRLPPAARDLSVDYVEAFGYEVGARTFVRAEEAARPATRVVASSGDSAVDMPMSRIHASLGEAVAQAGDGEVIEILDNATYGGVVDVGLGAARRLTIRAQGRPCLAGGDPTLRVTAGSEGRSELQLEGLLLGGGIHVDGYLGSLTLVACSLDLGESRTGGQLVSSDNEPAHRANYILCRCLTGGLHLGTGIRRVVVADSIVDELGALAIEAFEVQLERTTVLGGIRCGRLEASDALLEDLADVDERQLGCIRFSRFKPGSRLPTRYRCVPSDADVDGGETAEPAFSSLRPASPTYAQLSVAPPLLLTASEAGDQVGAFAHAYAGLRSRNLRVKLNEFLPVGLTPVVVMER